MTREQLKAFYAMILLIILSSMFFGAAIALTFGKACGE